jgi:methyl-CpG-binding domain protein 4
MTDDEDRSKSVPALTKESISRDTDSVNDADDWASTVSRARLRSGRPDRQIPQESSRSQPQSFRESQGLVRCSIRANVDKDKSKKSVTTRKGKKNHAVAKGNKANVVVPNTQPPVLNDSPEIEKFRSHTSEQADVHEIESSFVPESSLGLRPHSMLKAQTGDERHQARERVGPTYNECSTRGVDFTWEREDATNRTPLKPELRLTSQFGSDEAISPEKLATSPSQPLLTPSKRKTGTTSQFFSSPSKKPRSAAGTVSCIDVPPLSNPVFGLIQEELAHQPFQLLVAVIFLNKTRGKYALPVFREVIEAYPTPQALEAADIATLSEMIRPLGLFNQRATTLVSLARVWNLHPPTKGRRVMTPKYPKTDSHRGIKPLEVLGDDDSREGALEIGHLPGIGAYAFDSWRIFCRDELRDVASGWNGENAGGEDFEPEWKRVIPNDKELRAYLRWMWLKEGFRWHPVTGEKEVASEDLLKRAELGGLDWDYVDKIREENGSEEL